MALMLSGSCHPILFGIQWQPKILKALNVHEIKMGKTIEIGTLGGNFSKMRSWLRDPNSVITPPSDGFKI